MSGLENFLAPFSHLLFANRNLVIFFLCLGLFLAALDALIHRWKSQRLDRDLSAAKSGASSATSGRRYAASTVAEEAPREQGGALPPIKGGRTYARNLGSALQKAGVPSSPIYSPPSPPGWATNTTPGQPGQPTPQYPAPPTPWGAPAAPQTPWAFQGGPGRPAQGPAATPAPLYQPQPGVPPTMPQPSMPSMPGPGVFSPPSQAPGAFAPPPPPFGQPTFPIPATGSSAAAQPFAPPGPSTPPMMPAFPAPPAPEPSAPDAGRRGKPKRRRFNFNVLENLEKIVQPRPAEPLPTSGWTPPAAPPAAAVAPPAASAPTTPTVEPPIGAKPAGPQPAAFQLPSTPLAEATTSGGPEQPAMDVTAPPSQEEDEKAASSTQEPAASLSEPEMTPEPEAKTDPRRSMRSMMFGEEVAAPETEAAAPAEPEVASEQKPSPNADVEASAPAVEPSWPSYSWSRQDEASSSREEAAVPETSSIAPATEEAHEAEPVEASSTSSDSFDPWTPSYTAEVETTSDPESTAETAAPGTEGGEAERAQAPDQPVAPADSNATAGTLVIIEDDATAASYYATLFRGNGYRVEVANDGVSGVDLATRLQPQVILLDVMMPRQNGILVLQTLRASDETKNTPVVVMSNFSEPTLIKRALQLGALEYVIKTQVEGPALLTALPRWMNREKAFAAA